MISPNEQLGLGGIGAATVAPLNPVLAEALRRNDAALVAEYRRWFFAPPPLQAPSNWLEQSIILHTPFINKVPFTFAGRHYMRDQIDDVDEPGVTKQTTCAGTGSGKTMRDAGQMWWAFKHDPFPGLYIMPSLIGPGGVTGFNNKILITTMEASPCFQGDIPRGANRHNFSGKRLNFIGNDVDFAGSNSAVQLGNKRCRRVWLGEQDKFKPHLGREASPDYLAGERTKNMVRTQIIRSSTPSREDVGIWPHLIGAGNSSGSDLRRRFLPCPHCQPGALRRIERADRLYRPASFTGWFVLIKDEQYNTALPNKLPDGTEIPFAPLRWDAEARRKDGTWDMARIHASTRFECPHCGGHVRDEHRLWLDERGLWIPTRAGETGHRGYQMSSFYTALVRDEYGNVELASTWGGMAEKFLTSLEKGDIGGWINSELAEVNANQQSTDRSMIEISDAKPKIGSVIKLPILSADRQARYPGFWYVVRDWTISVLRPSRTDLQQVEFFKQLPTEEKMLVDKIAPVKKEASIYAAEKIIHQIQRTDHWARIAEWLIINGLTGQRLTEYFQVEFQTDLIRMLEFICKLPEVNIPLGRQGDSAAVEIGSADSWEEIDEAQRRNHVLNQDMVVDAAYGHLDSAEVYAECFRRCPPNGYNYYAATHTPYGPSHKFSPTPQMGFKPFALFGWTPCKGFEEHKTWPGPDKIRLPYGQTIHDPFTGKMEQRQYYQYLFVFSAQWALGELARVRKRYEFGVAHDCRFMGSTAEQRPVTLAEYNKHMKGYFWDEKKGFWDAPGKKGGNASRLRPNHLFDCEKNGLARAVWKGIFKYQKPQNVDQSATGGNGHK